jgi:hemerythrin-like domain-containing protein
MEATEILKSEHRVIEGVLETLEEAVTRLETGQTIRPGFFLDVADFNQNFADGCHHRKEEGVLFVAMADHGIPEQGGPVGVMLAEHEQGRAITRSMLVSAKQLQAGDQTARQRLAQAARGYISLLRQHIFKEDHILFPMADRVIPADQYQQVLEDFEKVESEETGHGVHEKYLDLAHRLKEELAAG